MSTDIFALKRQYQPKVQSQKSKFCWKDLVDLNHPDRSHNTPLLVIAHIDVNAFFAQLEQLRLGLSAEDPVVCVQWNSLIAVSYAARKYGISRMDSLESARKKCPNLVPAHTAVFKKGDPNWSYREAGVLPNADNHKVSLDPYRRESRKMMRLFRSQCDKVEKASVDESFMDFGRLIYAKAMELFPMLTQIPDDLKELLPPVPTELPEALKFAGEIYYTDEEDPNSIERDIKDWDDVFVMMGSEIAANVRHLVEEQLGYTTSCGVSRLKTISKLASGFLKPDNQVSVRSSAIPAFCENFEISDFWSMGGKTGHMIQLKLSTPSEGTIKYIRENFTMEQLQERLSPDTLLLTQLYKMVRGELYTPLNLRTDVKSMASSKNFRADSVKTVEDINQWMPVFCGDILQRLQEMDEESGILSGDTANKIIRRPKTVSIHFRSKEFQSFTRQCSIPLLSSLTKLNDLIYKNGIKLAQNALDSWNSVAHGELFPMSHFGIAVTNFEEIDASRSIDDFAVKSDQNTDLISSMFAELKKTPVEQKVKETSKKHTRGYDIFQALSNKKKASSESDDPRYCSDCNKVITDEEPSSHKDYHLALKLSREYQMPETKAPTYSRRKKKIEKGQSTLPFAK